MFTSFKRARREEIIHLLTLSNSPRPPPHPPPAPTKDQESLVLCSHIALAPRSNPRSHRAQQSKENHLPFEPPSWSLPRQRVSFARRSLGSRVCSRRWWLHGGASKVHKWVTSSKISMVSRTLSCNNMPYPMKNGVEVEVVLRSYLRPWSEIIHPGPSVSAPGDYGGELWYWGRWGRTRSWKSLAWNSSKMRQAALIKMRPLLKL